MGAGSVKYVTVKCISVIKYMFTKSLLHYGYLVTIHSDNRLVLKYTERHFMKILIFFFYVNIIIRLQGGYQEHNRIPTLTLVSTVQIDVQECRERAFLWVAGCVFYCMCSFHISPENLLCRVFNVAQYIIVL